MNARATKRYLSQLAFLSKNNALASALSYGFTIYLANKLGPAIFGSYSLVIIASTIISLFVIYETELTAPVLYTNLLSEKKTSGSILITRGVFFLFESMRYSNIQFD